MDRFIGRMAFAPENDNGGVAPPAPPAPVVPPAVVPDAHPVTAPWAGSNDVWKIGEAGKERPWYEAIPEQDVRDGIAAKAYKTPAELAMAYTNLMKMQRDPNSTVALPPENATPEQINEFYTKLGRPAEANAYDLKMPEGVQTDPAMVDFAKNVSFELGLNPKQAQTLADKWNTFIPEFNAAQVEADRVENEKAIGALETKWGPELEANKAAGRRAMDALGLSAETVDAIDKNIGTAPIIELLALLGRKSDEPNPIIPPSGGDPNDPANMTKEQVGAKIAQLNGDAAFQAKYTDKNHPENRSAVEYMQKLYAKS